MLDSPNKQAWWQGDVRLGKKLDGYWPVTVAEAGTCQFVVRRWPEYVDAPMSGVPTEHRAGEAVVEQKCWRPPKCRELPVVAVRLNVNGKKLEKRVIDKATAVLFNLTLKPGSADIRASLLDTDGEETSGAYYV